MATTALADAPTEQPLVLREPMTEQAQPVWYGWATLLGDIAGISTFLAGVGEGVDAAAWVGFGVWLAVPPLIHVSYGNWARGGASFLMRGGITAGSVVIAYMVILTGILSGGSDATGVVIFPAIGALVAMIVDATVLAFDEPPEPQRERAAWSVVPLADARSRTLGLALAGGF